MPNNALQAIGARWRLSLRADVRNMMNLRRAKLIRMLARVSPPLMWAALIAINLFTDNTPRAIDPHSMPPLHDLLAIALLFPYLLLIYIVLPPLIYPQVKDGWNWRIVWLFFAGLTVGLGPIILYWCRVDKWLSLWIQTEEAKQSFEPAH